MKPMSWVVMLAVLAPLGAVQAAESGDGSLSWQLEAGLGYDSNVFEANDSAYVDYWIMKTDPTKNWDIDPVIKSGWFIPFDAFVFYNMSSGDDNIFRVGLDLDGEKYIGSGLGNADKHDFQGVLGNTIVLSNTDSGVNQLDLSLYVGRVKRIYYDHDDGEDKLTVASETNVSERYTYNKQGVAADWEHSLSSVLYKVSLDLQQRDYVDPVRVSQLDSSITDLTGSAKIPLAKGVKLRVGYQYKNRDYSERKAKDLDGNVAAAALLNQTYNRLFARLHNRFGQDWRTKIALDYTTRSDDHVGYSDYAKTSYLLQAKYDFSKRWEVVADYKHWERDYDKAYAFDVVDPAVDLLVPYDTTYVPEKLFFEGDRIRLGLNGKLAEGREVSLSLRHDTVTSTDDRYTYDRDIIMATYTYVVE